MNIVVLGNVCIDKNNIENTFYEKAGGPPTFVSSFFSKTKDSSFITIASYGADFLPYKNGLNLYPSTPNLSNSLVYENIIKDGKRSQKCHFYKENTLPEINKQMQDILKNADVLFISPLTPYFSSDYIRKVLKITSRDCLKILSPQGYFRDFDSNANVVFREFKEVDDLLPLFDFVILSSDDYPNIERLSLDWSKKYDMTFIITKAQNGAEVINKNGKKIISTNPIPAEQIVDSIGAGDVFSASFAHYYLKTKNISKSINFANKAAGEKIT